MSFRPEVEVSRRWESNHLIFATRKEAKQYAEDLMDRWWSVSNCRVVEVEHPVTHTYADRKLEPVKP